MDPSTLERHDSWAGVALGRRRFVGVSGFASADKLNHRWGERIRPRRVPDGGPRAASEREGTSSCGFSAPTSGSTGETERLPRRRRRADRLAGLKPTAPLLVQAPPRGDPGLGRGRARPGRLRDPGAPRRPWLAVTGTNGKTTDRPDRCDSVLRGRRPARSVRGRNRRGLPKRRRPSWNPVPYERDRTRSELSCFLAPLHARRFVRTSAGARAVSFNGGRGTTWTGIGREVRHDRVRKPH
jgi:hypothetical protein